MAVKRKTAELQVRDFLSSAKRRSMLAIGLIRGLAVIIFLIMFFQMISVFGFSIWNFKYLATLGKFFLLLFIFLGTYAIMGPVMGALAIIPNASDCGASVHAQVASAYVRLIMFSDPEPFKGTTKESMSEPNYIWSNWEIWIFDAQKGFIIILVILILISGIGFISKSDVKLALITFFMVQINIVFALSWSHGDPNYEPRLYTNDNLYNLKKALFKCNLSQPPVSEPL